MFENPSPLMTYYGRKQNQGAIEALLRRTKYDLSVTLNSNNPITHWGIRHKYGQLIARLDCALLGPNWYRRGDDRLFGLAFLENRETNMHLHAVLRLPRCPMRRLKMPIEELIDYYWRRLVRGGSADVQWITDQGRVIRYVTKQLWRPQHPELYFITTEFHPQGTSGPRPPLPRAGQP